ncbi:4-hydroxy-tetrahydrodipicolinate synthase [Gammaproteobacteria bacterium]|jgi:4-hydroxy-tetrahydrodipicolinate synthase|nr:4-hydroxy-tetrahydrodipicolinate synthase [Gammaproteobacteria bacterium]MDA9921518.1 4-hydroxy-tetrahydrodipicolinate synthase [Gammaproteobacteria bacterium]MDB2447894.1 4-hydroxy-tetrahydrodipicolinate synthase [Gammaproteobacteria bacterium]MDB2503135.1 4-hydroxy-tetrahydrodipicolinate synthase [Gammaproteobacteria bacterium]
MQALQGSLVALVTPLTQSGGIDYKSLERLIDWHIDQGTDGIVSVGTTGESATLNVNEHIEVIEFTVKHVNKRVPVIAGTGANSTQEAIDLSEESRLKGADFVLLVTPYYNKPNQKGLIAHYEQIANSVEINQILYNVPSRTACDLLPESVKVLSDHQNIVGIKEAVDDMNRIKSLINISKTDNNFQVFSGDDPTFMHALNLGAHGVISVAANVIPKSISEICSFIRKNNKDEAKQLNEINNNLYDLLFVESNPIPVKWMLYKMGLIENSIRLPLIELDETFHEKTLSELKRLKLL